MNKPITIARQEFAQAIVDTINKAELPAFVISDVLKSAIAEVDKLAQAQYKADAKAWEEKSDADAED